MSDSLSTGCQSNELVPCHPLKGFSPLSYEKVEARIHVFVFIL